MSAPSLSSLLLASAGRQDALNPIAFTFSSRERRGGKKVGLMHSAVRPSNPILVTRSSHSATRGHPILRRGGTEQDNGTSMEHWCAWLNFFDLRAGVFGLGVGTHGTLEGA